ncbi:MAG: hypothetical protein LR005_00290 [Candidatus Pacebacteria bacterium]|nr:hypothetical protein [Candidatus Paceibacterota bacterium]
MEEFKFSDIKDIKPKSAEQIAEDLGNEIESYSNDFIESLREKEDELGIVEEKPEM